MHLGLGRAYNGSTISLRVVHAFQKKSTQGIKTSKRDIDLIRDRLKRLKEVLP
jgi:phage-related protein